MSRFRKSARSLRISAASSSTAASLCSIFRSSTLRSLLCGATTRPEHMFARGSEGCTRDSARGGPLLPSQETTPVATRRAWREDARVAVKGRRLITGLSAVVIALAVTWPSTARAQTVLLDIKGSGNHTSTTFTAPAEWTLTWSYDCSGRGSAGPFIVTPTNADGSFNRNNPVSQNGTSGQGVENYHSGGPQFLEVLTVACDWDITATTAGQATTPTTASTPTTQPPVSPTTAPPTAPPTTTSRAPTTSPATVSPSSAAPGNSVSVTANGFAPSSPVSVSFSGTPATPASTASDASGRVVVSITVPNSATTGNQRISLLGKNAQGAPHESSGLVLVALAQTGANDLTLIVAMAGVAVLVAGWLILERARWTRPVSLR